ncbi:helix-turn-helix domain-containing protein [Sphingopyxis sp. MWB1]|uniref:helix-turn-helix domain-containing protein n=1 Tax=Sphingopyxis sp. MWB1 TaxID=1537715 RepID=UPI00051A0871|nr:helix-turn-helix transcriptional regulator [Sphingopyxis sp. MWB1]
MEGKPPPESSDRARWNRLTEKQRACLDLLLEHQTSKQIARRLNISKPTVDQRITAARAILGAADRAETAVRYARLKYSYDRIIYDPVQLPPPLAPMPSIIADGDPCLADKALGSGETGGGFWADGQPFGKLGSHGHGLMPRLAIMAAMLVTIIIALLGGLGIAETLSRLLST